MNIFWYDTEKNVYKTHVDALRSGKECYLYYNDDLYNKVNWSVEPTISADQLYKLRAQEIRDSYERVILCLSGGIDSRNVMEIFYKNKIHVDEIISVGAFSQDEFFGSDENNNKEIYVNVKEYLKELHIPNTKKTFIDYTEQFKTPCFFNLINNKKEYWYLDLGCWKSFHNLFWKDLKKHVITDNKKTCFIMGTGKTYLQFDNIGPHVIFTETDTTDYGFNYQDENLFRENFYWGNTNIAAEVVKKQAYIMLDIYNRMIDKKMFVMNYVKIYDKVIYRHCKPLFMPTRKSTGHLLSIRDEFMKRKTNSDIYKYYIRGLQQMSCDIGLKNKTHTTRKYYLKNV